MAVAFTKPFPGHHLGQPSLTFLEPGTSSVEDNFFHEPWGRGWFGDDSSTLIVHFPAIDIIITSAPPQIIRR